MPLEHTLVENEKVINLTIFLIFYKNFHKINY